MIIEAATPIGSSEANEKKDPVKERADFGVLALGYTKQLITQCDSAVPDVIINNGNTMFQK